jgi:hypothetical protein
VHDDGKQFVELFELLGDGETGSNKIRPGLSSLQFRANWMCVNRPAEWHHDLN